MKTLLFLILLPIVIYSQDLFEKGEVAYEKEDYKKAISIFLSLSQDDSSHKIARDYLGKSYAQLQLWEESSQVFTELVKDYPYDADFHFKLGGTLGLLAKEANAFKALSLLDDIKFHLKKAIELDPTHLEARWALLKLYLELPAILGGNSDISRDYAFQLDSLSPVDGALAFGYIERELENFKKAEFFYSQAVELGQSTTTYLELAELYKRSKKDDKYFKTLERGIKTLNSILLASDYVHRSIEINKDLSKAYKILNTLNLSELNSEEEKELILLKSKLDLEKI